MEDLKGLRVWVSRSTMGDCTNGGISAKHNTLTLVGIVDRTRDESTTSAMQPLKPLSRVFPPTEDAPAVVLVRRRPFGERVIFSIEPWYTAGNRQHMFGGNYASSSDGRFCDLIDFYGAVAIHDRCEAPF